MLLLALFGLAGPARAQIDFTESNLPILVIEPVDTIRDEPKVDAFMGLIDNGPGQLNRTTDAYNAYAGQIGIELRGSTSQQWPKKPYGFETRLPDGSNNNVALLGMPAENDWILYPSYFDRTLLRNVLAYHLGERLLPYAPRTRYVELLVDGDYRGIYILTEKIKRDAGRVDLAKLTADDNGGDEVTGGYLLKVDKGVDGDNSFAMTQPERPPLVFKNDFVQFVYPKPAAITPAQRDYIQTAYADLEATLAGPDFDDPETGYAGLIDVESFIDFLLINEVARNLDGYRISTFFYKEKISKGGKWHMGPVWDFNFAFGSANYCQGDSPEGWAYDFNTVCPDDYFPVPFYWARLLQDAAFQHRLRERYLALRQNVLHTDSLHTFLDDRAAALDGAIERNRTRWPGTEGWFPATFIGQSYAEDLDWLKEWLADRLTWMDGQLTPSVVVDTTGAPSFFVSSNPYTQPLLLTLPDASFLQPRLVIFDALGRIQRRYALQAGTLEYRIPVALEPGSYTAQLRDGGTVVAHRAFVRY